MLSETKRSWEQRSPASVERQGLLERKIAEFGLKLEGTRLERLVHRLHDELRAAGVHFLPRVYLSDEWGCPEGIPIIGVPFYLADENLTRLEDEMMEGVEAETDDEIMRYLRHEAGHAFCYAYRLYENQEWLDTFGPYSRPYVEEYTPRPFSRKFVRHLPAWYAQKHPDEDFAETFAVWLTPDSNWRELYREWGCYQKLLYVDQIVRERGQAAPLVTADDYDTAEEQLFHSVADYYRARRPPRSDIPPHFDTALREIFQPDSRSAPPPRDGAPPAEEPSSAEFLRSRRRLLVGSVVYWTGLHDAAVRSLVQHMIERCEKLDLRMAVDERRALVHVTAMITTLCMNKLFGGDFIAR